EDKLEGYKFLDSQREIQIDSKFEGGMPPRQIVSDLGWRGLRFRSVDEKHIVQFNRDGFVFSRLEPYTNWVNVSRGGLRLWDMFKEMAKPVAIHRIGLRYINRIQ